MPLFEVIGVGKDTRRQRKRCYSAATEETAIEKAAADGILATKVIPLPPEPASESQISYARSLGISIPENPNLDQMSDLISQKVDGIADSWLIARYDFLPFGDGSGGTLSTHTVAYESAAALFEDSPKW